MAVFFLQPPSVAPLAHLAHATVLRLQRLLAPIRLALRVSLALLLVAPLLAGAEGLEPVTSSTSAARTTHHHHWGPASANAQPPTTPVPTPNASPMTLATVRRTHPPAAVLIWRLLLRSCGYVASGWNWRQAANHCNSQLINSRLPASEQRYLAQLSSEHNIPLELIYQVIWLESKGQHHDLSGQVLRSSKGALGIMQLMPQTAHSLQVNPHELHDNLRGGVLYLAQLTQKYQHDWAKVLAAYNWGPYKVDRVLKLYGSRWIHALPQESWLYLNQAAPPNQTIR